MGRRRRQPPTDPAEAVAALQADERVLWLGVKHYSVTTAVQVERAIRQAQPVAVLVEGPSDATEHIPHLVHPDTVPPVTVLSTFADKKNEFGQNGILSPSPQVPARFRGWWPLVRYAPEYRALVAGHELGAELQFIDAPLRAQIPFEHIPQGTASQAVSDRRLAESAYFRRLAERAHAVDFEAWWHATFEARGLRSSPEDFQQALLMFGFCARHVNADAASLSHDGTLLREAHMKWHVDQALKKHAEGTIAVVVGAYHAAALAWTRGKKARSPVSGAATLVCQHSYRALARLYALNRSPAWGRRVYDMHTAGAERPIDDAAQELLLEVLGVARRAGVVVSTGDGVGAWAVARNLATLRASPSVGPHDVADAVTTCFVKGDVRPFSAPVDQALKEVMTGRATGRVCEDAGRPPLLEDFYAAAKRHRVDTSGARKTIRCDLGKQERHRHKSAFLHRCAYLRVPMFGRLEGRKATHFQGPDLVRGTDTHLVGESWAVRWTEEVDDRLLELSDRGTTVELAAASQLLEELLAAEGDVSACTTVLLRAAQMQLVDSVARVLDATERAQATDDAFDHLVRALTQVRLLARYRAYLPEGSIARLELVAAGLYQRACLRIPSLSGVGEEQLPEALDRLQSLVRYALTEGGERPPDLELLVGQVRVLVARDGTPAPLRGAGCGVLYGLGRLPERILEAEVLGYAAGPRADQVGAFLDGLFLTGRSLLLASRRLQGVVDQVVRELPQATFQRVLPDLRRAFTRFIPSEIEELGRRMAERLEQGERPLPPPLTETQLAQLRGLAAEVEEVVSARGW